MQHFYNNDTTQPVVIIWIDGAYLKMRISFEVVSYSYRMFARDGHNSRMTHGITLFGHKHVVNVQFMVLADNERLPTAQLQNNVRIVTYRESDFPHMIDMLRNEKPLFFTFDDNPEHHNSSLGTRKEGVGEAEQH